MINTLFLSASPRARQIIGWLTLILAAFGVVGLGAFFRTLVGGGGVSESWEAAQVAEGLLMLRTASILLFAASIYLLLISMRYRRSNKVVAMPEKKGEDEQLWFQFPTMNSYDLLLYSGDDMRALLEDQIFEAKDLETWKELLRIYGRKRFKGVKEYDQVRTYLITKTKDLAGDAGPKKREKLWEI